MKWLRFAPQVICRYTLLRVPLSGNGVWLDFVERCCVDAPVSHAIVRVLAALALPTSSGKVLWVGYRLPGHVPLRPASRSIVRFVKP